MQLAATHSLHTAQFCFLPVQNPSQDEPSETRRKRWGSLSAAATKLCFKSYQSYQGVWVSLPKDLSSADKLGQILPKSVPVCQNEFKEKALNKQTY